MKLWHKISNRFRRRRPDEPLVRPTAPLTAPAKRRSVKALNVLGWAAAAAVVVTVAWALPYIVAVATLGELCPWTPPGISDPSWSCGASTSAKSSLAPVPHPAFRALGTLAFAAPSGPRRKADVFAVNADGTDLTNLTRSDDADDRNPAWSPDGTAIAFETDHASLKARDIYVATDNGASRQATVVGGLNYQPAWSSDGRRILFASERWDPNAERLDDHYQIYSQQYPAGAVAKLTRGGADSLEPAGFPTATTIAFSTKRDGNWEIYVMRADGSDQRNLSDDPADDEDPSVSPDGTSIAFVSDRGGSFEVYVMDTEGTTVRRLTRSSGDKSRPVWSPDGRNVAFVDRDERAIYVIDRDGSGPATPLVSGVDEGGGLAWRLGRARPGAQPPAAVPGAAPGLQCKHAGVRYTGRTPEGGRVCFTLTSDGRAWIEIGFNFVRASGCPNHATGTAYIASSTPTPLGAAGRIDLPGSFTASIRGAGASGDLADSEICGGKTFGWTARRGR